ncbi:GCP3 protein, partial [Cepphus grylle]|nr:GCP3 protein [Cepphus grylle]
ASIAAIIQDECLFYEVFSFVEKVYQAGLMALPVLVVFNMPSLWIFFTELSGVLHQCHVLASEMVHFIHQMQYYITFEVLECSWDELWNKVQQAQDLDHIIAAHEVFLDTIIARCLLDSDSRV